MIKKLFIQLFVLCFALLISISSVNAFSTGDTMNHTYSGDYWRINGALKSWPEKAGPKWTSDYTAYTHYLDKKEAICIDGLRIGAKSTCKGTYKINNDSDVLNPTKKSDYVLLYMLSSGDYSYKQKEVAVRAWLPFTSYLSNKQSISVNSNHANKIQVHATYNSGLYWAADNENTMTVLGLKENTMKVLKAYAESVSGYDYDVQLSRYNSKYKTDYATPDSNHRLNEVDDVAKAKKLFNEAINKAATYKYSEEESKISMTFNNDISLDNNYIEEYSPAGVKGYKRRVTFSAKFVDADKATSQINIKVDPDANGYVKLDHMEYSLDGQNNWTRFDSSFDFRSVIKNSKVVVYYRAYVYAPYLQDKKSINVKFSVVASSSVDGVLSGAIFSKTGYAGTCQRIIVAAGDGSASIDVTDSANLVWEDRKAYCEFTNPNTSKTDEFKQFMKDCCRASDSSGFSIGNECDKALANAKTDEEKAKIRSTNKWCQKETLYCSICDGNKSVPQVCSEFGNNGVPKCEDNADAIINDPDNIKLCVIDYSDEANNSYKMLTDTNVSNNDYCNVYCKEDYKMSLPLGRWVSSGRAMTFTMNVNASKSCYTDLINYDKFISDLNVQKAALDANSNDALARSRYKNILNQYKVCASASWDSDIKFNPEITLQYDETDYMSMLKNTVKFKAGKKEVNGKSEDTLKVSNDNIWLCSGNDVDDTYNECKNGITVSKPENQISQTLNGYYDPETFNKVNLTIPLTKYAKKVSFASAVFVPDTNLFVESGSGTISSTKSVTNKELKTNVIVNGEKITDVSQLPIALKRDYGAYKFNIFFNNVGEYFESGSVGRLIGGKNSVALKNNNTTFSGEYICYYTVNCPECNTVCKDDPKHGIICDPVSPEKNPETCVACKVVPIPNNNDPTFIIRQISLNNINPTNRKLGINLSTVKGKAATNSIVNNGENIYNGTNGKAEYSITLTPAETRKLQQYNNLKVDEGYNSLDDFDCYYYSSVVSKEYYDAIKEHDYIVCKSKLLNSTNSGDYKLSNVEVSNNGNVSWIEACDPNTTKCIIGGFYGPAFK